MRTLNDASLFRQSCYIDGCWMPADSGATIPVTDPATGEQLGTVPRMGAAETARAVAAAEAALPAWRARTAGDRCAVIRRWFELMMDNKEDLAAIMTSEQGKPLAEARVRSITRPRFWNGSRRRVSELMEISFQQPIIKTELWLLSNQ